MTRILQNLPDLLSTSHDLTILPVIPDTDTAIPRYDQARFWAFSGLMRMQKRSQNPTKKYICIRINVRSNDN